MGSSSFSAAMVISLSSFRTVSYFQIVQLGLEIQKVFWVGYVLLKMVVIVLGFIDTLIERISH